MVPYCCTMQPQTKSDVECLHLGLLVSSPSLVGVNEGLCRGSEVVCGPS